MCSCYRRGDNPTIDRIDMLRAGLLALLLMSGAAEAQSLVNADMVSLQPQIARDDKGFRSCGMRAVVVVGSGNSGHTYDFSVNVYPDVVGGMVKAGKYPNTELQDKTSVRLKPVLPAPITFWFAAADHGVPMKPQSVIPAESVGFILGQVEMVPALTAVLNMAYGKQVQFALRYKSEQVDQVIAFAGQLREPDLVALNACISGIQTRLESMVVVPDAAPLPSPGQ